MWWRIFIPTWRFFDVAGAHPELLVLNGGQWQPAYERPRFKWYSLFFNPKGTLYHARNNLLERLVHEVADGADPAKLISFALVRDLAGGREFKIVVDGETLIHSPGRAE